MGKSMVKNKSPQFLIDNRIKRKFENVELLLSEPKGSIKDDEILMKRELYNIYKDMIKGKGYALYSEVESRFGDKDVFNMAKFMIDIDDYIKRAKNDRYVTYENDIRLVANGIKSGIIDNERDIRKFVTLLVYLKSHSWYNKVADDILNDLENVDIFKKVYKTLYLINENEYVFYDDEIEEIRVREMIKMKNRNKDESNKN